MNATDRNRIRLGMICFVASGLMTIVGLWLRGPNPVHGHSLDIAAFVRVSLSPNYNLTWAILLTNLVVQFFAWLALWGYLRGTPQEKIAFRALVLSLIGNGLFLPIAGVLAFTAPTIARLHEAGFTEVVQIANTAVFGTLALPFLLASAVTLLGGAALHAWAIFRSPTLPSWAAVPYVLHALCLTVFAQVHYALEFSGGPLLLISSLAVAAAVWRNTAADPK